jgi:hypothetical protein
MGQDQNRHSNVFGTLSHETNTFVIPIELQIVVHNVWEVAAQAIR